RGVDDLGRFTAHYIEHNDKLWEKYRNGLIKVEEVRWKRMWLTLIEFKIADEPLSREMGGLFLDLLPTRKMLFPYAHEILEYLTGKGYNLHLITNGFEKTQHSKLQNSGLDKYFKTV